MILDSYLTVSDAQALSASGASTNYIDFATTSRKLGVGEPLAMLITIDTAADTASGNETYAFAIETDDNTSFSSATTVVSKTIAGSALTAGSKHILMFDHQAIERYVRLYGTLGGTTPSVTFTASVVPYNFIQEATVYPDGFTVS